MGHWTFNLDIGQESKQHFDLTVPYFKKRFSLTEHWQLKTEENNKREDG